MSCPTINHQQLGLPTPGVGLSGLSSCGVGALLGCAFGTSTGDDKGGRWDGVGGWEAKLMMSLGAALLVFSYDSLLLTSVFL